MVKSWNPLSKYTTKSNNEKVVLEYGFADINLPVTDYYLILVRAKNETRLSQKMAGHLGYQVYISKVKFPSFEEAERQLKDYILINLLNHLERVKDDAFPFELIGDSNNLGWIVITGNS